MFGAQDSRSSNPGSSPDGGHCVVFLSKTIYSHSGFLHPANNYKWVPANLMLGTNPAMT